MENEQNGIDRAEYGARLLSCMAVRFRQAGIKGASATRLKLYRQFYRQRKPIGPTPSDQSLHSGWTSLADMIAQLHGEFVLGWSHYFFVDLVVYNRLLPCYVLIDLKSGKLTHQDLGQMQMYVNYFDRYVKTDDELPTVGILLCDRKNDAVVELTLPEDANIYASKYHLYLPSKRELAATPHRFHPAAAPRRRHGRRPRP